MLLLFWSHISDDTQYRRYKVLIARIQNVVAKQLITIGLEFPTTCIY
jgi:hypothetical protein